MYSDRKYLGKGEAAGRGNILADMYVYYLDCGDGFMGIYICQNWSNRILETCNMCSLLLCQLYLSKCKKKNQKKTTPNLENVLYSHYYYSPTFIKKNRFLLSKANASCWAGCLQYLSVPWYPVSTLPASFCRSVSIPGCKISPRQLWSGLHFFMGNTHLGQLSVTLQLLCICSLLFCLLSSITSIKC